MSLHVLQCFWKLILPKKKKKGPKGKFSIIECTHLRKLNICMT